ncbi:MAG: UDP-3-O-(3-hydroxymyristoyl)glucosamine N-acyltransferase [Phycisphaerales bacterium]|nr:UDP-3-O-(3-hydroxymyristoyl)glucosamine N-acyltransferase [Phycisphaerales bacterium]
MTDGRSATSAELAERLGGSLKGRGDLRIDGVDSLDSAACTQLTFIADKAHARRFGQSRALVALVTKGLVVSGHDPAERALIEVPDAQLALISVLEFFAPEPVLPAIGTHPRAWCDESAQVHATARIGPNATVLAHARIGAGCVLHAGCFVGDHAVIGERCVLHAGAVVRERCLLGCDVILHPGAIIGSDGFGYRPSSDGKSLRRIPHLGNVHLHDGVEIGAATCVDRAKFGSTVVGVGSKIDNLCQVGHNTRIGRNCVIAGQTAIAGSVTIGDGVRIGGQSGIRDHVTVGDGARLGAKCALWTNVPAGATFIGIPAQEARTALREIVAIRTLAPLAGALKKLVNNPPQVTSS